LPWKDTSTPGFFEYDLTLLAVLAHLLNRQVSDVTEYQADSGYHTCDALTVN